MALGGGGARGLAHIGVLKTMDRAGVNIACLGGTSIGAVVGAAYAVHGRAEAVEQLFFEFMKTDIFKETGVSLMREVFHDKPETVSQRLQTWLKRAYVQAKIVSRPAILDSDIFRKVIDFFVPNIRIEDLPLPFCAVGADLRSGMAVLFRTGSLRAAVYASAALPGVVRPLALNNHLVVDGGVVSMVPIQPVRSMGADVVIGVDVDKQMESPEDFGSAINLLFRIEDVQGFQLKELELREADLVLRPNVGSLHWSDFERSAEMIKLGEDEADRHMETIMALSRRSKMPWSRFFTRCPLADREWIEI